MKPRDVKIVLACAASQPARILAAPAVKLIIAGARPAEMTARNATPAPLAFGSISPIASPGLPIARDLAGERARPDQQPAIAELAGDRVFESDARQPVRARGFNDGFEKRAIGVGRAEDEIRHDLIERRAGRHPPRLAFQRVIDREADRFEHGEREFRKPAPARLFARQPREHRRLGAVDVHRDDHRAGFFRDQPRPVIDFHQTAGDRQPAFREDDQRIPVLDRIDQRARAKRIGWIERDHAHEFQKRLRPPCLRDRAVDGEDRLLWHDGENRRGVEKAHMVERDDRIGSRLLEIFQPLHLETVEGAKVDREQILQRRRDDRR